MTRLMDPMISELEREAAGTRRLLERIPEDKLDWTPHPKSMPLRRLALHIALIPGRITSMLASDSVEMTTLKFDAPPADSVADLLAAFEQSVAAAKERLGAMDDTRAQAVWTMYRDGQVFRSMPRIAFARTVLLNHWYHHRGQLTVYLRMLDVPLPAIYGSSADEGPFAAR